MYWHMNSPMGWGVRLTVPPEPIVVSSDVIETSVDVAVVVGVAVVSGAGSNVEQTT